MPLPSGNPSFTLNGPDRVWVRWGNVEVEFSRTEALGDIPDGLTEADVLRVCFMLAARKSGLSTFDEIRQNPTAFRNALVGIRQAVN